MISTRLAQLKYPQVISIAVFELDFPYTLDLEMNLRVRGLYVSGLKKIVEAHYTLFI